MFYELQSSEAKNKYKEYLRNITALSRLFSDNSDAYLDSRVSENLFCKAFNATNSARDDSTADAYKNNIGIGIKTFIHNPNCLQKIAEFNRISSQFTNKSPRKIIEIVSEARNQRLRSTKEIYNLDTLIYHYITRDGNSLNIFEEEIKPIENIVWDSLKNTSASISFQDEYHYYSFNKSKSVLQRRFTLDKPIETFVTKIIEDPIDNITSFVNNSFENELKNQLIYGVDAIYLPLYAPSSKTFSPAGKSGLNQWNARGRKRDNDEVYIPVPSEIHKFFPEFFIQSAKHKFNLELPNGKTLSAKLCQSGLKGLMSNPNKELGHWILREIINMPEKTLVTRKTLDTVDIDSVLLTKINESNYKLDFANCGKYEDFKEKYLLAC